MGSRPAFSSSALCRERRAQLCSLTLQRLIPPSLVCSFVPHSSLVCGFVPHLCSQCPLPRYLLSFVLSRLWRLGPVEELLLSLPGRVKRVLVCAGQPPRWLAPTYERGGESHLTEGKVSTLNQTTEDSYTYTLSVRSSSGHPERTATQAQAKTPHCVCP